MINAGTTRPKGDNSPTALLAQTALFSILLPQDLQELAKVARPRTYRRGEVIFRKEDPGYILYLIVSGAVKIAVSSGEGEEIILTIMGAGQFFGELALFDEQARSADAEAIENTEVLTLQREEFLKVLESRPRVAIQLLKVLSQRIRATDDALGDAAFLDIPSRLAKRLLDLAEEHGERTANGLRITLRLTQQDLASMIGARRENVNRALAHYQSRGWLSKVNGYFTILNEEELRARSVY